MISLCFLGDVGYNMADSLMIGAAKMGMDIRLAGPRQSWPQQKRVEEAQTLARESGAHITLTEDAEAAVRGCDSLYTGIWVSMCASPDLRGERIHPMLPYEINTRLMALTNNPTTIIMRALTAVHTRETRLGSILY